MPPATARAQTAGAFPVTLTDDLGRRVTIPARPQRIVSLYGGLTEIVCALGACPRLAAVTDREDYPPEVAGKERVGSTSTPNLEKILSLEPDLVLVKRPRGRTMDAVRALEGAGVPALVVEPSRLEDLEGALALIGRAAGVDHRPLWEDIEERLRRVRRVWERAGRPRPTVFFEVRGLPRLTTRGDDSIVADIIAAAGGQNVVRAKSSMLSFSLEKLLELDPQVYVAQRGPMNNPGDIAARPQFQTLGAVRAGRVHVVDEYVFSRPGPRAAQAVEELARLLYPDLFAR